MEEVMTFPMIKAEEIVTMIRTHILSEAEAKNISESDILQPKAEVMQNLYMRLVQSTLSLRNEHFLMSPFTENIYYEFMESTIPLTNIFAYMQKCMPLYRVYDFKKKDLICPTAKRTLRFWSAVYNVIKFELSRGEHFRKQTESMTEHVQNAQKLKKQNGEFLIRINKMKMVPAKLEAEITPLTAEVSSLQETLDHDLKKTASKRAEESANKKCTLAEKDKILSDIKVALATAKESQALRRSQIVECPDQLKEELRRLKEHIMKMKLQMTERKKRLSELSLHLSKIQSTYETTTVSLKSMEESGPHMEEHKLVLEQLEKWQNKVDVDVEKLKTLTVKEDQLKEAQATRQSQVSRIKLKAEQCKQENKKEFQNWLGVLERLDERWKENSDAIADFRDKKHVIEENNAHEMHVTQSDKRKINEKLHSMLQAMDNFHGNLFMQLEKHKKDQAAIWEKRNKVVESFNKRIADN